MGKSTTAAMFADFGIPVWDADAAVHRLYSIGGAAVEPLGAVFPQTVENKQISRNTLKALIAKDSSALQQIETIVHPLVAQDRADFINTHHDDILLFDIPLLYETGAEAWLDAVAVVTVPAQCQRQRVMARDDMTETLFQTILSKQMPDAEKRKRADYVIETLTLDGARADVQELIETLGNRHA